MNRIALEFRGFVKYISHANDYLVKWFGEYAQHDVSKIIFMASREWEVMDDMERRYFMKANWLEDQKESGKKVSDKNAFMSYMLTKRYATSNHKHDNNDDQPLMSEPDPRRVHSSHLEWNSLTQEQKDEFADTSITDIGMAHVIEKRDILHEKYNPIELSRLECILKTFPRNPINAYSWFLKINSISSGKEGSNDKWKALDEREREIYNAYTKLDTKRYIYEKKAWQTHMLMTDLESENFTLEDYQMKMRKSSVDTIISVASPDKLWVPAAGSLKRPLSPFSLYVRAYRYQIRDKWPEFKFGDHLRKTSEAWYRLSEEEKQVYRDESDKLKREHKEAKKALEPGAYTLPEKIFSHSKLLYGPSKPSHLVRKVPSAMQIYCNENQIDFKQRHAVWAALTDEEKAPWIKKQVDTEDSIKQDREKIKEKLKKVKELVKQAQDLERLKKQLRLLQTRNRQVKLYL